VQNPGTSLQQMLGNANDSARALNEQDKAATDEFLATRKLNGPLQMQSAMDMAGAYNPAGMTVWHGSPHVFEVFNPAKLGAGAGAQNYGKGFYMAGEKPVAEEYAKSYQGRAAALSGEIDKLPKPIQMDVYKLLNQRDSQFKQTEMADMMQKYPETTDILKSAGGNLYKVDLPDTHVRRMLNWDEPLKNQPSNVRKFAKSLNVDLNDLGGDLIAKVGKTEEGRKMLQEAGIPGIKYLGQEKGNKGQNYVVFDPNHLTILERNAQSIK
jgi:hypothetical protein